MPIKVPAQYRNMEFLPLMKELSRLYQPYRYVEIGVKDGYTFNQMGTDPWVGEAIAVDIDETRAYGIPARSQYPGGPDKVKRFHMASCDFAREWLRTQGDSEPTIDFLFIDGDHSYPAVMKDFETLSKFVRPLTGLIFMHDTYPVMRELTDPGYCGTAWKAAQYIARSPNTRYNCEIVTLPGPWAGLSIIRMLEGTNHMHWEEKMKTSAGEEVFRTQYQGCFVRDDEREG